MTDNMSIVILNHEDGACRRAIGPDRMRAVGSISHRVAFAQFNRLVVRRHLQSALQDSQMLAAALAVRLADEGALLVV